MVAQVAGVLALDVPAAYAFGRLKFPGRDFIFYIVLLTMMMPGILEVISLFDLMSNIGLVDTVAGVILPGLARVVGVFILRQFFMQLPREMEGSRPRGWRQRFPHLLVDHDAAGEPRNYYHHRDHRPL